MRLCICEKEMRKLDKDELKRLYLDEKLSLVLIAAKLKVSHHTIFRRLKTYGVPIRDKSEARRIAIMKGRSKLPHWDNPQDNPHWKGGKVKRKDGYVLLYCKGHPFAKSQGPEFCSGRIVAGAKITGLVKADVRHWTIWGKASFRSTFFLRL